MEALPPWPQVPGEPYGPRYADALALTAWGHRSQLRRIGSGRGRLPYVNHVLEVSSLVWIGGGDEDQAIAGLLHDALEDWPQHGTVPDVPIAEEMLLDRYGSRVVSLVRACTDEDPAGSERRDASTWEARKRAHLEELRHQQTDHLLVPLADKTANARALTEDLAAYGAEVWSWFNAGREQQLWYYRAMLVLFEERLPDNPLTARLGRFVSGLQ